MSAQNIINVTNDLAAYDWSTMKSNSDVNKAFNIFLDTFSNLYDTNCPFISHTNNKKKNNNNSIIWINIKIKNAIKKKKLYRDSLTLKNTVSIDRYKRYINKVNAIIRRQKNAAYKQFFCNNNCSPMWVKIKKLTDHNNYNTILDDIFYDNNTFSKCKRINAFNTLFSSIATDLQD